MSSRPFRSRLSRCACGPCTAAGSGLPPRGWQPPSPSPTSAPAWTPGIESSPPPPADVQRQRAAVREQIRLALLARLPDGALVGPCDALVAAEAERVADGVGVDAPAVAVGADGVLPQGRAEGEDAALLGLDVVDIEVEMELLGVLPVGPLRGAVVLHRGEGQLDLAALDAGPAAVAALLDRATHHLGVESSQLQRVRAVDDDVGESQHPAILPRAPGRT